MSVNHSQWCLLGETKNIINLGYFFIIIVGDTGITSLLCVIWSLSNNFFDIVNLKVFILKINQFDENHSIHF